MNTTPSAAALRAALAIHDEYTPDWWDTCVVPFKAQIQYGGMFADAQERRAVIARHIEENTHTAASKDLHERAIFALSEYAHMLSQSAGFEATGKRVQALVEEHRALLAKLEGSK